MALTPPVEDTEATLDTIRQWYATKIYIYIYILLSLQKARLLLGNITNKGVSLIGQVVLATTYKLYRQ